MNRREFLRAATLGPIVAATVPLRPVVDVIEAETIYRFYGIQWRTSAFVPENQIWFYNGPRLLSTITNIGSSDGDYVVG